MEETTITKEDFESFIKVRDSGVTNMFDKNMVVELSGLSSDKIEYIIRHFTALTVKHSKK